MSGIPCPQCTNATRVIGSGRLSVDKNLQRIIYTRNRVCSVCNVSFTTIEIQRTQPKALSTIAIKDAARHARYDAQREERIADAMAKGRPIIIEPLICPHCNSDLKHPVRMTHNGLHDYRRYHRCGEPQCGRGFWSAVDKVTGRLVGVQKSKFLDHPNEVRHRPVHRRKRTAREVMHEQAEATVTATAPVATELHHVAHPEIPDEPERETVHHQTVIRANDGKGGCWCGAGDDIDHECQEEPE